MLHSLSLVMAQVIGAMVLLQSCLEMCLKAQKDMVLSNLLEVIPQLVGWPQMLKGGMDLPLAFLALLCSLPLWWGGYRWEGLLTWLFSCMAAARMKTA